MKIKLITSLREYQISYSYTKEGEKEDEKKGKDDIRQKFTRKIYMIND